MSATNVSVVGAWLFQIQCKDTLGGFSERDEDAHPQVEEKVVNLLKISIRTICASSCVPLLLFSTLLLFFIVTPLLFSTMILFLLVPPLLFSSLIFFEGNSNFFLN